MACYEIGKTYNCKQKNDENYNYPVKIVHDIAQSDSCTRPRFIGIIHDRVGMEDFVCLFDNHGRGVCDGKILYLAGEYKPDEHFWLNIYPDGTTSRMFKTEKEANAANNLKNNERIHCLHIKLRWNGYTKKYEYARWYE